MIFDKDDHIRSLYDMVQDEKNRALSKYSYITNSAWHYGAIKEELCEANDEMQELLKLCEEDFFDANRKKSMDEITKAMEKMKLHAKYTIAELIQLLAVLESYKPIK